MVDNYPQRIQVFRDSLIRELPRSPNTKASRAVLAAQPTHRLILSFITWRMRLIPAKPRRVGLWTGGVTPLELRAAGQKLQQFLRKVEAGEDLTPHLSDLVKTKGVILPGASPADRGKDIDGVLTRDGLHHFHIGTTGAGNPKGRSAALVFAEVLEAEFRIVAISGHGAFAHGSSEQLRFFGICRAYIARDVPPGQSFMANPVMSSGHSMIVTMFAYECADQMETLDPQLDDRAFIDRLYGDQPILRDGQPVARPPNPSLTWHFEDLKFGILDRRTKVFFCIYPFFDR
jgi:hypothetical protein